MFRGKKMRFYGLSKSRRYLWQLKVIGHDEDGDRKRVPVSRVHRDKQFGEIVGLILIQFDNEGVLGVRKPRIIKESLFNSLNNSLIPFK